MLFFTATAVMILLFLPITTSLLNSVNVQIAPVVQAQEYQFLAPVGGLGDSIDVSSENSFPNYVQTIITLVIGFTILAAIVLVIAGGFQYMTSTSQGGTTEAKKKIQNAVLGLILALASVVILQTINPNLIQLHGVETITTSGESFEDTQGDNNYRATATFRNVNTGETVTISAGGDGELEALDECEDTPDLSRPPYDQNYIDTCPSVSACETVESCSIDD